MRAYKLASEQTEPLPVAGDVDSDEEQGSPPNDAVLLGSRADKKALVEVLQRFSKDNLADESDQVVAAIRMQVKGVPPFRRLLNIVSTLGLWLLFQPREDSASLLLTKQGRFICWGRGQEAQPGAVRAYLGQVICFLLLLFALMLGAWSWILHMQVSFFMRGACFAFSLVLLVLLVSYTWAQRPRRDCGTTFRQHFEVQELCVGTYVRVDEGRRLSQLCARRRLGHLQLCFSRRYPKAELLSERLPPGAPGCGNVVPLADPPSALAGDSHEVQREAIEQEGGLNSSFLTRIAAILAVLSLIGAAYDYTAFLDTVRIDGQLCLFKVHGCNWRVENSRLLGKVRRAEGANPPADYVEGGCNENGDYCNYFLRPTTHCSEKGEAFTNDITAIHVRLECKALPELAEVTRRVTFVNPYEGTGQVHTMFLMTDDLTVWSMPLDETSTTWNKVLLTTGMRIVQIGPKDSRENMNLQKGVALHPVELLGRCLGEYRGHVDLVLVETQDLVPMFEEDCEGLQEACKAEGLGPETNGYWPPHRIFDHSYEKTICIYRSLKLPLWLGKVWTVLEQGEKQGLTCRGQPRKSVRVDHANNSMITSRVETCKDECSKEPWCTHVFYKGEVPEAFRTDFDFIPPDMKKVLRVHNTTRAAAFECLLYESCPTAELSDMKEVFVPVTCGEKCGDETLRCMMVRQGFVRPKADEFLGGQEGCHQACREAVQDVAQCNAYVYSPLNGGSCALYGPDLFLRPYEGWKELDVNYDGAIGTATDTLCFVRSTDPFHQGRIRNRQFADSPGILLRFTDKTTCGGCLERTLFEWLREPSAFCMVLSHLITLFGACYVARRAHASVQLGKAAFSGKPVVHMTIVQDPANTDSFEVREAAYRQFLSKCCEVAEACRHQDEATHEDSEVDCWQRNGDAAKIVPIHAENYETYELCNKRRSKCYIDKELLGIQPEEKVRSAWSDTPRHGIYKMLFGLLFYYLILFFISWVAPQNFKAFWTAVGLRPVFLVIIPCIVAVHHYVEIRREVQSLCVLTSWGRLLHLTRRPPPDLFPAVLCPAWYGGTSIQLDSFKIGRISLAQLDMPAKPLLEDRMRSGFSQAWRRGAVTLRGSRGLLQVRRENGEALEMYQGITSLAEASGIQGLHSVGPGGANIAGLCPRDDVLIAGERHIWEHRFDAFGFFGDPFNYSTLLSLSDQRILVTRARWPKGFSLVGCLIGPRTCSNHCSILQERLGYFPYVTLTSVWYRSLESYVTQRVRAPPFWPGFMKPIMSLSVNFLEKWMQSYPSALQVTQRPYGIPRHVVVPAGRRIWLQSVDQEEKLRIVSSDEPAAPRGQYVEEIIDGGEELDLTDSYWSKGNLAPENSKLLLQAGDPEWDGYADEPWLHQMRAILDHISGRSQAKPETWEPLEEPPRPEGPGCISRFLGWFVGAHMLGHHNDASGDASGTDEDDD